MIKEKIEEILGKKIVLVHPKSLANGDYTFIADVKTAEDDFQKLQAAGFPEIERIEFVKPRFINFYLSKKFFADSLKQIIKDQNNFGKGEKLKGQKFLVEHTQPNPFKLFHAGHLMNNAIGESVARIVRWNGAEVKTASYHGDIGMHAAKAVWALKRGDNLETAYATGAKAYEENENAKAEIQEINKKIYERSDGEINRLYDSGREQSLKKFEDVYKRLDSHFDYSFFESESGNIGKEIVAKFLKQGIFEESEGAVVFRGEKYGLHTRVFLNSDGLPTYEAKEIGLAEIKKQTFSFDHAITITANEQDAFFKVVEAAIGEVYPELKGKLEHLSHGILRLPGGKMSSRTGEVITAEGLIDSVKERVKGDEKVAIGAIKYMILRQAIGGDIVFDIDKSVSTEGDSGVYLQYAHARANSVLEKAGKHGDPEGQPGEVREVERLLYRFPEIVERAYAEFAPHHLTTYLTELAGAFNNFYAHEQVISDEAESQYRLAIVEAFKITIRNGLEILGIPAPERM